MPYNIYYNLKHDILTLTIQKGVYIENKNTFCHEQICEKKLLIVMSKSATILEFVDFSNRHRIVKRQKSLQPISVIVKIVINLKCRHIY